MAGLRRLALALVALAALALGWRALRPVSPEDEVRAQLQTVVEAAEAAQWGPILDVIDPAYRDEEGLTRDLLKGYLFQQFNKRGPLHIVLGPIAIEAQPDGSRVARFSAVIAETTPGSPLPIDGEALDFEVTFAEREGDWRVRSQHHSRALDPAAP